MPHKNPEEYRSRANALARARYATPEGKAKQQAKNARPENVARRKLLALRPKHKLKAKKLRDERTAWVRSLKTGPCTDCGNAFHPVCMDFDHVRGEKLFDVARPKARSKELLLAEISKCDLVCSNCHRIRTFLRREAK